MEPSETLNPIAVSIPRAAKLVGVSERHLRTLISEGTVPSFRLGNRHLVSVAALEALAAKVGDRA